MRGHSEGVTNLHLKEFLGDNASLVVQGVEFSAMSPIVVTVWPILQGHKETEPRLPHHSVLYNLPP